MAVIAFYLIAAVVLVSALSVIMARNPVHSVLWLILAFFSSAGLLVLIGAEFLAMLLVKRSAIGLSPWLFQIPDCPTRI